MVRSNYVIPKRIRPINCRYNTNIVPTNRDVSLLPYNKLLEFQNEFKHKYFFLLKNYCTIEIISFFLNRLIRKAKGIELNNYARKNFLF